jgi:hypothetical protein
MNEINWESFLGRDCVVSVCGHKWAVKLSKINEFTIIVTDFNSEREYELTKARISSIKER